MAPPETELKGLLAGHAEALAAVESSPDVAWAAAQFLPAAEAQGWVPSPPAPWLARLLTVELAPGRIDFETRRAQNRQSTQKSWICPMSTDPFMVIQTHRVFKEIHMLVDVSRLSWGELAQDGHMLLLAALCCPEEHVIHVLRQWVATKSMVDKSATYNVLEELVKGGEQSLFTKQQSTSLAQEERAKVVETEEPLSELQIEKSLENEVVEEVLSKLRDEGVLNKLSDGIAKRLANNDSLETLMSEAFLSDIIERSAPRLKASLQKSGSRRYLLKIVTEQLDRSRPMEGLTEAVSYALQGQEDAMQTEATARLREVSKKRGASVLGAAGNGSQGVKKAAP